MTSGPIQAAGLCLVATFSTACSTMWDGIGDGRPEYLRRYFDAHHEALGDAFEKPWSRQELAKRLAYVRVLYLGDHHRDPQLHRQILELIDWVCDQGHRPVLGLEALGSQDNPNLQEFLRGRLPFDRFRERVARRWPESWLDHPDVDRRFYRDLLQRARSRDLDAFPLEVTPRLALEKRDAVIATNIRRAMRIFPQRLIIVVVGYAHLVGNGHLRGRVGAESVCIGARLSPRLQKALAEHPPVKPGAFFRSNRDVLFFAPTPIRRISD